MPDDPHGVHTLTDVVLGTPAYMAPEQHLGERADARADQYAWCVALWEALVGHRPFEGEPAAMAAAKLVGPPTVPRSVPRWLARVLSRGLAVDADRRFASMDALRAAVEKGLARGNAWIVTGVVITVALCTAGAELWRRAERAQAEAACGVLGAEIGEVWNEGARADVRAALLATGVSHAATTADKLMPWLDAHAQAWQASRTEACLDATVREQWNDDTMERAQWCFEDRRMEFAALVEELQRADAAIVHKARTRSGRACARRRLSELGFVESSAAATGRASRGHRDGATRDVARARAPAHRQVR